MDIDIKIYPKPESNQFLMIAAKANSNGLHPYGLMLKDKPNKVPVYFEGTEDEAFKHADKGAVLGKRVLDKRTQYEIYKAKAANQLSSVGMVLDAKEYEAIASGKPNKAPKSKDN